MNISTTSTTGLITRFVVKGLPRPKGSLRPVGRRGEKARLVEQVDPKGVWRSTVIQAAKESLGDTHEPFTGPVEVKLTFRFLRPKSYKGDFPITRTSGDLDKLQRNIYDAIQTKSGAGVIKDDSQIVCVTALKQFTTDPDLVGVSVELVQFDGGGMRIPGATKVCACGTPSGEYAECTRCVLDMDQMFDDIDNAA